MLNVMKYKDVITKEKETNPCFDFMAVCEGKPVSCKEIVCNRCLFRESDCPIEFIKWLFTEHMESPTLNTREWGLLNFYEEGWIARERTGDLYVHQKKPAKIQTAHGSLRWEGGGSTHYISKLKSKECFDFIQFEDDEPWSIEVLLAQCSDPNMTNYEYFKENIEEIHKEPDNKVAVDIETGIPVKCGDWNCEQCKFDYACQYYSETTYEIQFMKWLAERKSAEKNKTSGQKKGNKKMDAKILKDRIEKLEYMIDYMEEHAPVNMYRKWMICVVGIFDDVPRKGRLAYIAEHDDEYRTVSSSFDRTIRRF